MSIRKRNWTTSKGFEKEAWIVDYVDQNGKRHIKTFERKKEADAHEAKVKIEVKQGIHTADANSVTVAEAGGKWIANAEENGLERATTVEYRRHLDVHIVPYLGRMRLSQLSAPLIREFEDKLRHGNRSLAIIRRVRTSPNTVQLTVC